MKRNGFTLVELIVVMALLAIASSLMAAVLIPALNASVWNMTVNEAAQAGGAIRDAIKDELTFATAIEIPDGGSSATDCTRSISIDGGRVIMNDETNSLTDYILFGEGFYNGMEVSYIIDEPIENANGVKTILKLRLTVSKGGKIRYTDEFTISNINLELSGSEIVYPPSYTAAENSTIYYNKQSQGM